MATVKFSVMCNAIYKGSLDVPDVQAKTKESILSYIHDHLGEVAVTDLEWLEDIDPENAVTEDDVRDWGDLIEEQEEER